MDKGEETWREEMNGGKSQFIGNPSNHQIWKIVKEGEVYFHSPSQKGSAIILAK